MQVLEPLGFIRGFYRTEVQAASGQVCMLDTFGSHLSLKKAAIVKAEVAPEKRCSVGNPADGCALFRIFQNGRLKSIKDAIVS